MTEPWERLPQETAKAFYAFKIYRDLSPNERNLTKVSKKYRKKVYIINRWSQVHNWRKRALAYDEHLDALARAKTEEEISEMNERHRTLGMALQVKGAERLDDIDGKEMKTRDAIQAITQGSRLERLSRGEQTQQIKGEMIATIREVGPMPWEDIPEAKEALDRIKKKLREEKSEQPGA